MLFVIPSSKENRRIQARLIKPFVNMPETGMRWDKRGRGKAGVPIFDGAWGRKCSMAGEYARH